jgi:hypothetical protein
MAAARREDEAPARGLEPRPPSWGHSKADASA